MQNTIELTRAVLRGSSAKRLKQRFYGSLVPPRRRYRQAIEQLHLPPDARVLSIGCGYTAPDLNQLNMSASVRVGVDVVESFRRSHANLVRFSRADASALPFKDATFDVVICRSVIEHLDDPGRSFAEVFRVLAPNGRFVFLTPNRYDYVSLLASLIPNRFHGAVVRLATGRAEEDTFPTRYKANSVRALSRLARRIGFDVTSLESVRESPNYLQFNLVAYALGVAFEQFVQRRWRTVRPWLLGEFTKPGRIETA